MPNLTCVRKSQRRRVYIFVFLCVCRMGLCGVDRGGGVRGGCGVRDGDAMLEVVILCLGVLVIIGE